jgi:HSP20 family protein
VAEKDEAFEIEFAVPGMNKEDFKVNVENGILTVSSEKEAVKEDQNKSYTRKEFVYGSFSRSFTLPKSVNVDKIEGNYDNGILKIVLPKKEEAKTTLSKNISIS